MEQQAAQAYGWLSILIWFAIVMGIFFAGMILNKIFEYKTQRSKEREQFWRNGYFFEEGGENPDLGNRTVFYVDVGQMKREDAEHIIGLIRGGQVRMRHEKANHDGGTSSEREEHGSKEPRAPSGVS